MAFRAVAGGAAGIELNGVLVIERAPQEADEDGQQIPGRFVIQSYGFLREIRIRPIDLMPNMDVNKRYRLQFVLTDGDGKEVKDIAVYQECEGINA